MKAILPSLSVITKANTQFITRFKRLTFGLLFPILGLLNFQSAFGQTATATMQYDGGGGTSCRMCGDTYQCTGNGWGGWSPTRTFFDPTPSGTGQITQVTFTYYGGCPGVVDVRLNNVLVGSINTTSWSCTCALTGVCHSASVTSTNAAVLAAYNISGNNTVTTTATSGDVCIDRIVATVSYVACTLPSTPSLSWNPNPVCVGSASSLNISGNLNDATQWHVFTGSCGGTQVASTAGSSVSLSQPYASQYFVRGQGGCANPSSVTISCASVGPPTIDNVAPSAVCQNVSVNLNGSGTASVSASQINNGSTDNCSVSSVSLSPTSFNCNNLGNNTVTLTVTDNNGNTANCTANVTVSDIQNPGISCPANQTLNATSGQCGRNVTYTTPSASDNCSSGLSVTRTAGPASGGFFGVGTTTVTHQATDGSGNSASCSFTVTINDTQNPSISCPSNITANAANGTCAANVSYSIPSASDNCSGVTVALLSGPSSGSSFPLGGTTVTYRATDASGNTANCSFTVTVNDNQNPTISCPSNQTVNASNGSCAANVTYSTPTGTDNCPGVTVARTAGPASGGSFAVGTTTVTHVATDGAGNTASCSFTVTVVDNQNPVISGCPSNISSGTDANQCSAVVSWTPPTVSDNCTGATIARTAGQDPGTTFALGTVTVTYTATDAAGNTANCSFTVTVSDDDDPVITCPSNIVTDNDPGLCTATETFANATATDNCPGVTVAQTGGSASGSPFPEGTQTISFTATDAAGNTSSCSFTVTVNDNEEPVFFNCPADISVGTAAGVCSAVVTYATLQSNDNCDGTITPVQTSGLGSGATFPEGVTTETYTATDGEGNVGTCTFTVTVTDDEAPQLNCPSDQTVTFDGNCQYELLNYTGQVGFLDDNCDSSPTVTQSPAATTVITGSTEITITAEDDEGNTASCTFFVNPNDVVNPTITCPSNQQVQVNSICQFTLLDYTSASVSDDCDPNPSVTQVPSIGSILTATTSVTLTVTDGSGNTSNCSFNAIPLDATAPSIICPGNQLESFDVDCEFDLIDYTALPTVNDNCDASPAVTQSPAISTTISGTTVVTLNATDAAGNMSSCTFSVIPDDNTDPVISCPNDQNVSFNSLCAFNIVNYTGMVTATDNCDNSLTLTQSPVAGTSIGTSTQVQVTATDDDGNSASCTFNVIPADNTAPSASCPSDQVVNANASCQATLANYVGSVSTNDNCDSSPTVSQLPAAASTISGSTTVTMTVTDAAGNSTTCSFEVIPEDVTNPSISCGSNLNVNFDSNCQYTVGNYVNTPTVSDNCDATPTVTQNPSLGTVITGSTTVTLTATDDAGNSASCTFSINPVDGQDPTVSCPTNQTVSFDANCQFSLADYTGMATAADNCDQNPAITQSPSFGTVLSSTQVVTITATDDAGNDNSCTFSVIPADNTVPVVTCPTNQSEDFSAGCDFVLPSYLSLVTSTDNCDNSVSLVQSPAATAVITGATVITVTGTDNNGNSSSCTFSVLPDDNTDPTISCPTDQNVSYNAQCQFSLQNYTSLGTAADNCDANPVITQSPVSGTSVGTTTTITLTATDANGNSGTCTFDVIPEDNTNPIISCPADQTVSANASCEFDLLSYTGLASTSDNCDPSPVVTQSPVATTTVNTTTTVTLMSTDADGNFSTCTFDVIPEDNTDPVISCPSDLNVSFDTNCQYTLSSYAGSATVSDNCDGSPAVTQSPVSGTIISGQTEITLTATDASGNLSTCTFDVIPDDDIDPTVLCPADQIISSNVDCDVIVPDYTSSASASDNCDQSLAFSQSPGSGTIITVATTVTITVTDDNGNNSNCSFLVTPADDDNPSITCPGDQFEDFDGSCQFAVIDYTSLATATDNCSGAPTVTQDVAVGTLINGTTTITLTATDGDLNTATCSFDVTPDDNTAPSVTCPTNQTASLGNQCQLIMTDFTTLVSTLDNCDTDPTLAQSPVAGSLIGGTTVVTVTSTDDNGNIGTCTFTVTPADNTPPVLACPSDITESFDASCAFVLPSYTNLAQVSDNCDVAPFTVSQTPVAGTSINGNTTITFSVTDGAGNNSMCTFEVLPDDDVDPVITCPSDQAVSFDGNCQFTLADYTASGSVSDNCDASPVVTQLPSIGSVLSLNTSVTLTATDASGNTASCSFNVIPSDDTDPTVSCPLDQQVNFTANCEFTIPDYTGVATFADNCDNTPFVTQSPSIGTIVSGGTTVTITVLDDAGNSANCTFQVLPNDVQNPTVVCPSNVTETLSASCDFTLTDYTSLVTATDNCDTDVTLSQSPASGVTVGSNTTVTITGVDDAGNSASCTFMVLLEDNTAPTITCPTDQTVNFGPSCQFTMVSYIGMSSSADNCDPSVSVTQSPLAGSSVGGATVVTLSATDASGNVGTCTFNLLPIDNQDPNIFGCPTDITVDNDAGGCDAVVTYAAITATDNCDGTVVPALTTGQASGTVFGLGTTTVTYVATDGAGNSATCEFDVTVEDAEDPVVVCPSSVNVNVDPNTCGAAVTYSAPTASDNCASPVVPTLTSGQASGSIFPLGTTTVVWTADDGNGNTSTCDFTVTVVDDEDPVITCPADIVTDAAPNACNAFVNYSAPTVTDNCATGITPVLTAGQNSGSSFPVGVTTLSFIANDGNGNSATCSFTITVEDNTVPLILACPLDITSFIEAGTCGAVITYPAINATDNCAGAITPTLTSGQASGTVFPLGITTVTYLADDGNGNTSSCSFDVTIIDNEDPVITCPADITVTAEVNTCGADVTYSLPTVTDNCTSPIVPTMDAGLASGSNFPVGTTTVTYTGDDGNGNTATCSFEVTVTDDENPVITCPSDIVVDNDAGICGAVVTYSLPTVTDNCTPGIVPTLTLGLASGSTFPVGITPVRYQAVDASGNMSICSFSVTVNDVENPVVTCPANITVDTDPSVCQAVVTYSTVTVTDNCTSNITAVLTAGLGSGDPFPEGITTVTYEGTDQYNNSSTCSFTVTVEDNEIPTVSCPADLTEGFDPQCQLVMPDYTSLGTTSDNCDGAPVITQSPAPSTTVVGTTVVTLTSTDASGNENTCTFTITDNTPPVAVCPADQQVGFDINCAFELVDYTLLVTASDNCGSTTLSQDPAIGTLITSQTTVTITVEDDFGNTSTCDFDVIPSDNINPSLTCVGNQTVFLDANCGFTLPDYTAQAVATDNCDTEPTITQDPVEGSVIASVTPVTLTATDDDGNSISCTFSVTPVDNTDPTIVCPNTQVAQLDANCEYQMADYAGLAAVADNCAANISITQSPAAGSTQTLGTVVTLTAEDDNGNTVSCVFAVQTEDVTPPVVTCPADLNVDFDEDCEYVLTSYTSLLTATDNCSNVFVLDQTPGAATAITGTTQVTLSATDVSGNSASCFFNVTPSDNTPPEVVCAADVTVAFDENCQFEIADYIGFATTSDNCATTVSLSQSPVAGTFVSGQATVTLTGDDGNGNTASCTFDVIPEDVEPPTITCPADIAASLNGNCEYILADYAGNALVTDNCSSNLTVTQGLATNPSGIGGQPGDAISQTETMVLTVSDGNGNSAICSFDITLVDDTPPTLACPQNQDAEFNANCESLVADYSSLVTFSDNCGLQSGSQSPEAGTIITSSTEVTILVTDLSGNSSTCSFLVNPVDVGLPTITCPNNIIVEVDGNCQFEMTDLTGLATATDNCGTNVAIGQFPPVGTVIVSSTVVTMTANDGNGNEADCSFTVLPQDETDPTIVSCAPDQQVVLDGNCAAVMADYRSLVSAGDNCDIDLQVTQIPAPGAAISGTGTQTVTITVQDDAGNTTDCTFSMEMIDQTAPSITCPSDQLLTLTANCTFVLPDYSTLAATSDACGGVSVTQSPVAGTEITGQLNASLIAEDEDGNTSTCTFFVNVLEFEVSVTGTDVSCAGGNDGTATVTISGGTAPYTQNWGGFNPNALAQGFYTVTVTDANGCSVTGDVTINEAGTFTIEIDPSGDVVVCDGEPVTLNAGSGYAVYNWSTGASVQSITVSNEGTYWVNVTNSVGCVSNTDTVTVTFYDSQIPDVTADADGMLYCSNDTASTYQWYLNGDPIVGATEASYCPTTSGNYYVVITDYYGCTVTSYINEYTFSDDSPCATGIEEHDLSIGIQPNPSTGQFMVNYAMESLMEMELMVYDLMGNLVREPQVTRTMSGSTVIDLSNEADGIYMLRITLDDNRIYQERLVLVK